MSYRTIFAPVLFEATARQVVHTALTIARATHGHVLGRHLRQKYEYYPPVALYPVGADIAMFADEKQVEAVSAYARTLRSIFEEACDRNGVDIVPVSEALRNGHATASWTDSYGVLPDSLGRGARVADLSVVAVLSDASGGLERDVFEDLLMHSGRGVLMVPGDGLSAMPARVLVAWDGSQPAARALSEALPFLHAAKEVGVLTLGEEDPDAPPAEDAVRFLARHGVNATLRRESRGDGAIGPRLLEASESAGCDLLVMGGYSHSRMQQTLLGGVTRHIVSHAGCALFLAH